MTPLAKRRWLTAGIGVNLALIAAAVGWYYFWPRQFRSVTNSIDMQFLKVPAGTFWMGSPTDEEKRGEDEFLHEVTISKPFYLGAHEVTREQFERVMGADREVFDGAILKRGPDYPVDMVPWHKADEFCRKLSDLPAEKEAGRRYRLPTEAEWEYACCAGRKGEAIGSGGRMTPLQDPRNPEATLKLDRTMPVGTHPPNEWGFFDMQGNVWEWCQDWYGPYSTDPAAHVDPTGPKDGEKKVARGGSKFDPFEDYRSANRVALAPDIRFGMGFRVVMIEEPK